MTTPKQSFFAQLFGHRPDWPENMTPDEEKIMGEHFAYMLDLADKKKVLLAGPCFNPVFGISVMEVESEADALAILQNDPSVKGGLMSYNLQPMRASVRADIQSGRRYVSEPSERILHKEVTVDTSLDEIWEAWTTAAGIKRFFADNADIQLELGGPYEVYFNMAMPYGLRGSEDCRVLCFLPKTMLSFEWNAPSEFGKLRDIRTQVILRFEPISASQTRVLFDHLGWGQGDEWDRVYDYFDRTWGYVLENLKKALSRRSR